MTADGSMATRPRSRRAGITATGPPGGRDMGRRRRRRHRRPCAARRRHRAGAGGTRARTGDHPLLAPDAPTVGAHRDRDRGRYPRAGSHREPHKRPQGNKTGVRRPHPTTGQTSPALPGTHQPTTTHPPTRPHPRYATNSHLNTMINLGYAALLRREALCYIPSSVGRNSEEVFLGLMPYLALKGSAGDSSMAAKQRASRRRRRWAAVRPVRHGESWIA